MFRAIRRDARVIIIAVVAASVTAAAPAIAHGVHAAFAHNADKVDNKHAVGSGASLSQAKGKLVATATNGRFPAKFIPKVASASLADRATVADTVEGLVVIPRSLVASSATASDMTAARAAATAVPLLTQGNLSIYAKCFTFEPDPNTADDESVAAEIYVATSADGALLSSSQDDLVNGAPFLDDDTAETLRQLGDLVVVADSIDIDQTPSEEGFLVLGPDGTALRGGIYLGGKQGTPPGGNGLFGAGDQCVFGGYTTIG